jgi:hypothetical protein
MKLATNPEVKAVFDNYPKRVRSKMRRLRKLILETASKIDGLDQLEETLKWGEPSYLTKHGSTIRLDWKVKKPDQYAMYFKCTSKLVPTFREVYGTIFEFEGDRAIIFQLDDHVSEMPLKNCIKAGLTYHKVKQLDRLGM